MKKYVLILAVLMTSCIKEHQESPATSEAMTFEITTDNGSATRGTPITNASQLTTMGVFCAATGLDDWSTGVSSVDKMFNEPMDNVNGTWTYRNSPVYWGQSSSLADKFTFFAYTPYATADNGIQISPVHNIIPYIVYDTPTDVTKQPDLMVAVPRYNIHPTNANVSLKMVHVLTAVGFQVQGTGSEKIKGISITGISTNGVVLMDGSNVSWSNLNAPQTNINFSTSLNYDAGKNYYSVGTTMSTNLIAGNGYLMLIPQTLGSNAKLKITFDDGSTQESSLNSQTWVAGKRVNYLITLSPKLPPVVIPSDGGTTPSNTITYVGAFWRASERGERIIRIAVGNNAGNLGDWAAQVAWTDGSWTKNDIAISTDNLSTSELAARGITWNINTENPASAENYTVTGSYGVTGTVAANGYILFRIGLNSTYTPTTSKPARYAVIVLSYNNNTKYQKIYLRQGEDADYLMSPNDAITTGGMNQSTRPSAAKFSPYNLTASSMTSGGATVADHPSVPVNGGVFTQYPTQAGAFFQWGISSNGSPLRKAFHPVNPNGSITDWVNSAVSSFWSSISSTYETCPSGYHRPNDGSTSAGGNISAFDARNSEIRQSLQIQPETGTQNLLQVDNSVWGFYADGFFDRHGILTDNSNYPTFPINTVVSYATQGSNNSKYVAYVGRLFYNPTSTSDHYNASIFFPVTGYREASSGGGLNSPGQYALYMTSSSTSISYQFTLRMRKAGTYMELSDRGNGNLLRCVKN